MEFWETCGSVVEGIRALGHLPHGRPDTVRVAAAAAAAAGGTPRRRYLGEALGGRNREPTPVTRNSPAVTWNRHFPDGDEDDEEQQQERWRRRRWRASTAHHAPGRATKTA